MPAQDLHKTTPHDTLTRKSRLGAQAKHAHASAAADRVVAVAGKLELKRVSSKDGESIV